MDGIWSDYAFVGLGGNAGPVEENFAAARRALREVANSPLVISPMYLSQPWGDADQAAFLNQVVGFAPRYSPTATLGALMNIERNLGRNRANEVRFGPRTMDLDVLCWPGVVSADPTLTLPHPRLHLRRFVLVPLNDVAPHLPIPGLDRTVAELLATCSDASWVLPFAGATGAA
jgi:2-amino-4-hydroxy-6-hydroxymethyldihydropteridine diphosphokinase